LRKIIKGQIYRSIHYLYVGDSAWFFQVWYHILPDNPHCGHFIDAVDYGDKHRLL